LNDVHNISNNCVESFFLTLINQGNTMANPSSPAHEPDAVESVVKAMPLVLPLAGAVLMFLLAFIAVNMA
jgi:hypothetical protein